MDFREEIEKLEKHRYPHERGYIITDEFLRKSDVLSILDEHLGECVMEHQFASEILQELDIFDGPCPPNEAKTIEFGTGDHISIYVRRGHEAKLD